MPEYDKLESFRGEALKKESAIQKTETELQRNRQSVENTKAVITNLDKELSELGDVGAKKQELIAQNDKFKARQDDLVKVGKNF